ncbi:SDR family oxidoreductase [Mycobacterium sp. IS-1264]|uniref:SDR family oxidoreductase n=1 Tax=Mycobacterium sp. IS-1264 TaxID=1834158 RepID=UPI001F0A20CA|nr:SDR family oxidoreductase [Mycobacterium sp. IS-1264]
MTLPPGVTWLVRSQYAGELRAAFSNHQNQPPTGRFTTPEELADLVVFLAASRTGNIVGSDYRIDGGFITTI